MTSLQVGIACGLILLPPSGIFLALLLGAFGHRPPAGDSDTEWWENEAQNTEINTCATKRIRI